MKTLMLNLLAAVAISLICATASAAGLSRVIIVQTTDVTTYLHEIDVLRGEYKKAGVAVTLRVSQARFAGAEAGSVVVTVDMADWATLAKLDGLQTSDPSILATMGRIAKIRKITSDSLYEVLSQ